MAKDANVAGGQAKAFRDNAHRKSFEETGAERLVVALAGGGRIAEVA